jgi:hypothetical protein
LIKWFPTGAAWLRGWQSWVSAAAMIGAPLADRLMKFYATPESVGVWETFLTMGAINFVFMMVGALAYRVPPVGLKPAGWSPPASQSSNAMITTGHVHLRVAHKTPQFWLLAFSPQRVGGIGVIGMASPMLQEIFGGKLIGTDLKFDQLNPEQLGLIAAIAAGFTDRSAFSILPAG